MKYSMILLLPIFLCLIQGVNAQQKINYYPDSVRIELPDQHTLMVFEMKWVKEDHALIKDFPSLFKELLDYIQKSTPSNFSETGPHRIDIKMLPEGYKEIISNSSDHAYKPIGERTLITINSVDKPLTNVTIKEKQIVELLPPGWEVYITSKNYKVKVYAESFVGLTSLGNEDFSQLSSTLSTDGGMKTIGKKSVRARMILQQNKISQSSIQYIYPGDQISLGVSAGVGLFRDKLYPELSFKLGLSFKDHFNRQNIRTSLIYDNLFFAEKAAEGYTTNTNSFLSLSFEKNFNLKQGGPQWSGLGLGLLVHKSGDYFTGNTGKLFITHSMGRVNLVPEFYLTDDFKKFAFGMTLKYTF